MHEVNISFSTVAKWLLMLAILTIVLPVMLEMARNIWLNYGWSHPWLSSLIAAIVGLAIWWMFGGLVSLSIRDAESLKPTSPSVQQTATASGGSTLNQAGRDIIINQGVPETTVYQILSQKAVSANAMLATKYPLGYVLMGIANGKVIFQPEPVILRFDPDNKVQIRIDENRRVAEVVFVFFKISTKDPPAGFAYENVSVTLSYAENLSVMLPVGVNLGGKLPLDMFVEILDADNKVFVVGFKNAI